MKLFAVLGDPILHSRSPLIHNGLFRHFGIDAVYTRLHASSSTNAARLVNDIGLSGMNVTSPLKEELFPLMTDTDPMAKRLRAVNTVLNNKGAFFGANTDAAGVEGMLRQYVDDLRSRRAVVVGAGGAAKAAVAVLSELGAKIEVVNRTFEKAKLIAKGFNCTAREFGELSETLPETDLLLSCLPTGVEVIDRRWLRPGMVVIDANYGQTALKAMADAAGCITIDAVHWLSHQAVAAFRLFSGQEADISLIEAILDKAGSPTGGRKCLGLVGMMGSGKTTIGTALAQRLGWDFADTDQMIESRAGRSISEIFARDGEREFRRIEEDVIRDLAPREHAVVAFGGGSILSPENQSTIRRLCVTIWLWADPATLTQRTGTTTRPLLAGGDAGERLVDLLRERRHHYAAVADLIVDANQSVNGILQDLEREYRQAF